MTNLLKETLESLAAAKKTTKDVIWVGSRTDDFSISWGDFEKVSNIEYDSGYGGQEIASDLVVVGGDWWLERGEYDGSEWWEYKQRPTKKKKPKPFSNVTGGLWDKLSETNK